MNGSAIFLIVHVLKFSRGAAIYLPAGPSGHIIFSNYDVVFLYLVEFYIIIYLEKENKFHIVRKDIRLTHIQTYT